MGGKVLDLRSERLIAQGEERLAALIVALIKDGRSADIERATADAEYRNELYKEYGIS